MTTTTTGQKLHQEVKDVSLKEKRKKIECCDICKVDIREKKQTKKQTLHSLNYCFFYCCCVAAVTKSKQENKNKTISVECVCRKEDMNSETSN